MAMYTIAVLVAPVLGPTLGGWITDSYSWRWIFYINVPVGILSLVLTQIVLRDPPYLVAQRAADRKEAVSRGFHRPGIDRAGAGGAGNRAGQGAGRGLVPVELHRRSLGDHGGGAGVRSDLGAAPSAADRESAAVCRAEFSALLHRRLFRLRHALRQHRAAAADAADADGLFRDQGGAGAVAGGFGDDAGDAGDRLHAGARCGCAEDDRGRAADRGDGRRSGCRRSTWRCRRRR